MADLVTLGFKVDTREVKGASRDLDSLKRSADSAEQSTKKLASATAAVKAGAVVVAAAVTAASAAVAMLAKRGLESVDSQAKLARSLGSTTSALRAVQLAASEGGIANMEGALNKLNRRLGAAEMGVGMYAKSVQALGLDLQKLSKMDADEKIAAIADAVRDSGMSFQESARHLQQLGFEQSQANAFFRAGGDAIRAARKAVDEYGLAVSAIDSNMVEQANDAWARNALLTEAVQNKLAVELAPVIKFVADLIQDAAKEGDGFGGAIERGVDIGVRAIIFMIDAVEGVRRVFLLAGQGAAVFALAIVQSMLDAAESVINGPVRAINTMIDVMNRIPGVNIEKVGLSSFGRDVQAQLQTARGAVREGMADIQATLAAPMPSVALLEKFEETKEAMRAAAEESVAFDAAARKMRPTIEKAADAVGKLADNTDDAAKEAKAFATSFEQLRRRLDPAYASTRDLISAVEDIDRAFFEFESISAEVHDQLIRLATESMPEVAAKTREVAAEADPFAVAWENALKRVDDAFAGIWTGAFKSFKDFRNSITNAFKQMLAELAHAAITRPIMIQLGAAGGIMPGGAGGVSGLLGGGGGGMPGIPGGGGMFSGMLGQFGSGFAASMAGGGAGMFGGLQAGMSIIGQQGGFAAGAGLIAGNLAPFLPAMFSLFQGDIKSAAFQGGGAAIGMALGGPVGAVIGSFAGGLLGGKKTGEKYTPVTAGGSGYIDPMTGMLSQSAGTRPKMKSDIGKGTWMGDALANPMGQFISTISAINQAFGDPDMQLGYSYSARRRRTSGDFATGSSMTMGDQRISLTSDHFKVGGDVQKGMEMFLEKVMTEGVVKAVQNLTVPDLIKNIFDGLTDPAQIQAAIQYTLELAQVYNALNAEYGTSLELTKRLVDAFGGAGGLSQSQAQYYQLFHSETERATDTLDALTAIMAQLGAELPTTTAEFRALVEAQDLATEAGIDMYAALMKIAPAFHQATNAMEEAARAAEESARAAEEAARASLAAANMQRLSLQRQIYGLTGDVASLRAQELAELDPANWALQARIWALQEEQEASRNVTQASSRASSAINSVAQDMRAMGQAGLRIREFIRDLQVNQLSGDSLGQRYSMARGFYREDLEAGRGGDVGALGRLPGSAGAYLDAAQSQATSADVYRTIVARTINELSNLPAVKSADELLLEAVYLLNSSVQSVPQETADKITPKFEGVLNGSLESVVNILQKQFDAIDRNGDQMLSYEELVAAFVDTGLAQTIDVVRMINRMDVNFDGMVDQYELGLALTRDLIAVNTGIQSGFSSIDANLDGLLTVGELENAFVKTGLASSSDIWALMQVYDINGDGMISQLEMIEANTRDLSVQITENYYGQTTVSGGGATAGGGYTYTSTTAGQTSTVSQSTQWTASGYLNKNPDIVKYYQANANLIASLGQATNLTDYAAYHFRTWGIGEGRAFANGGTHMGGLRLVGERGPELEVTGPSRITSNNKLMQALGSSDELVKEVRALRVENMAAQRAIERNTREIKQIEQRWDKIGLPEQREFV